MTKAIEKFIDAVRKECKENNIKFIMADKEFLKIHGGACSGYFQESEDKTNAILAVATKKPRSQWLGVLVHESCHMDQFLEGKTIWEEADEALEDFEEWVAYEKELTQKQIDNMIRTIQELELDCELRTVRKIKQYGLPINLKTYAKSVNIYLYSYEFMRRHRGWHYFSSRSSSLFPLVKDKIQKSHRRLPKPLYEKFRQLANV